MMNSGKTTIYNSVSLIENNLSQTLNIKELANQAFFSKTHYQRLFQATIGEPVMEYVKKRRLQRAGQALCETDATVLEIALQYGYTSHEGFLRAFAAYFGMSPLRYRKRYAAKTKYQEEVTNMITNEARKNITRYANDIVKDWEFLSSELEKCCAPAEAAIKADERCACGMKVAFTEWASFIARINAAKDETQKHFDEKADIYELHEKAKHLMKVLDDIIFQMNLLRFLTGVEWSRMGEHGKPFEPILEGLTALCKTESKRIETATKLAEEINKQVQAEIKQEAERCINQAEEALREKVREGAALAEKFNALVIALGAHGRGFSIIARETEKSLAIVRENEALLTNDKNFTQVSIMRLEDAAFMMNLNAFNAAVESARAGDSEDCVACARGVMAYAGSLQHAAKTCWGLNNDYQKLTALLRNNCENVDSRRFKKLLGDVIFQAGFLNMQLSLESERTGREEFHPLSRDFEKALETLKQDEQLKMYHDTQSVLIERGKAYATAAGIYGMGIAYILNELNLFNLKINEFLL